METNRHYDQLLGLDKDWSVTDVKLDITGRRLDIYVSYVGTMAKCPSCDTLCSLYDHAPERSWRHLDTMQFLTTIHAGIPRIACGEHKVRTINVPWAGKHSRFTLLFEAFAIKVPEGSRSISDACKILRPGWQQTQSIMRSAVERGLAKRDAEEIPWIGIDEKSFKKGRHYISVVNDIEGRRILEVEERRDYAAAVRLLEKGLTPFQREMVCGVAIDMSKSFMNAAGELLPNADIVFDKFHIAKHLSEALDQVRRSEHRKLLEKGDKRLSKTKYLWLKGLESPSPESPARLEDSRRKSLNVAKAWHIKNLFDAFWDRRDKNFANMFFNVRYKEAIAARLKPITKVAEMLKKHLANILTYFDCYITNAISEGFNSKIQSIKANARGFRNFENYRTAILFFCGKLDLYPLNI